MIAGVNVSVEVWAAIGLLAMEWLSATQRSLAIAVFLLAKVRRETEKRDGAGGGDR